ncbi:MAG TPA: biotin--[acetyl-CoA-carboxylase] ligase [Bacteroidales bacterium]|nr:biotin--[acetyl-CoA-carboxylase] ligase [Bacteroidales bacterium]
MIIGSEIIFLQSAESTNTTASEYLKSGKAREGLVIRAAYQSSGKGQQGNRWESEEGKNLLFSVILFPTMVNPEDQFLISGFISLGITDFLKTMISDCKIKWPNDIYAGNDKIAGILIENSISGRTLTSSVAGIGLNINQAVFPDRIPNPVSLKVITGKDHDTTGCLEGLLKCLDKRYKMVITGDRDQIRNDYTGSLYRLNEWHEFRSGEEIFSGRILSVGDSGLLMVENKAGQTREFAFKEIEFIL